ncbi:ABC transporter permease [Leifsonia sp. LS1]|uniref:iron chelate uptake ABC transporter family permease subunit n=1 Tax=Leifsonia sp. LS1 TaxID=2828483 RepID=UPI001CFC6F78|nr:iron chelate uptake ABC transporter family permease subunit [Leifsonia sp. LS1]GIT79068.1 ABC transporter permease [Leifsonia sp. LS1]
MPPHAPTPAAVVPLSAAGSRRRMRPLAWRLSWLVVGVALLVLLLGASLAVGAKSIPLGQVLPAVLHPTGSEDDLVITGLRVPRTLLGLVAGAALGVAGGVIQAFTRNPLADPGILGVNAGAALAVAVGVALLGMRDISQYLGLALVGAIAATVVVALIGAGRRGGSSALRMTLAGVGVAAVLGGITSAIQLSAPSAFQRLLGWSAGSLVAQPLSAVALVTPVVVVGLVLAAIATRGLNALALGEDLAASLGSRAAVTRTLAVVSVTLLAGAATAAVGPIAFVGLMIPHAARAIVGPDQRWILAFAVVLGPCLLLSADILGRIVMNPAELPVGLVTAFVGAPVLIALARRGRGAAL